MRQLEQVKVLSVDPNNRPQDVVDIKNLLAEASSEELCQSARLLQLIHERGYNRGKDLLSDFARYHG